MKIYVEYLQKLKREYERLGPPRVYVPRKSPEQNEPALPVKRNEKRLKEMDEIEARIKSELSILDAT